MYFEWKEALSRGFNEIICAKGIQDLENYKFVKWLYIVIHLLMSDKIYSHFVFLPLLFLTFSPLQSVSGNCEQTVI